MGRDLAGLRRGLFLASVLIGSFVVSQLASIVFGRSHAPLPLPVQAVALLTGFGNALFALGIVLVYRASRVINFSHAAFGTVGVTVYLLLAGEFGVWFPVALVAGVAASILIGAITELLFVRRFFKAPRLVLTVVTIGLAQGLVFVAAFIPAVFGFGIAQGAGVRIETPMSRVRIDMNPIVFTGDHFALVGASVLILVGLAAFFRRSAYGIAVRGAAENDDRALLLGLNVRTLSTIVWAGAAGLAGLAAILQVPIGGASIAAGAAVASGTMIRALAAAVFARMENLPAVVVASLAIAVFEQSVFFAFNRNDIVDVVVFAVILGGLLLQRRKLERAQGNEAGAWAATEEIRPVPPELAGLPAVRKGGRVVGLVGGAIALAYPFVASPRQINTGSLFLIYGIVAVSLVVLIGWGGQISLGQWAIAASGALVGGALTANYHLPFPIALLIGSLTGSAVAVLLGLPALRIRGLFLAVTTLSFSVVTTTTILSPDWFGWLLPKTVNRPKLAFIDFEDERAFWYLCLLGLVVAVLAAQGLRHSRTGRVLIAMRDNERNAQAFGINLVRTRLSAFALSGFLAAFAGVLFANHQHAVSPQSFLPDQSIQMFLMAVIGGLGSVTGVLLGPLYIGATSLFLPLFRLLASSLGVLLTLLVIPGGLGALAYGMRDAYLRRVAIRNKIFVPSLLADYLADGSMARTPLAPKTGPDGDEVEVPVKYRVPSRIGTAGSSQLVGGWKF